MCEWSSFVGIPDPGCLPDFLTSTVTATYSSEGMLYALERDAAPTARHVFYFGGRPVALRDLTGTTETWRWVTTDHLGTPIATTSTTGALLWSGGFEPFGEDWQAGTPQGASENGVLLRFPGQWADEAWEESSLGAEVYYNVHRWYERGAGRYMRPDPANLAWPLAPEPFLFVGSNPPNFIDRTGLYKLAPACLEAPFGKELEAGIKELCEVKTRPGTRCHQVLSDIGSASGGNENRIPKCFEKACRGRHPIACDSCLEDCATNAPNVGTSVITLGTGQNPGCPRYHGYGYGETLFHETLHHCEFGGTEPHHRGQRAAWFRYAEHVCYGWRSPLAPRKGPPR